MATSTIDLAARADPVVLVGCFGERGVLACQAIECWVRAEGLRR